MDESCKKSQHQKSHHSNWCKPLKEVNFCLFNSLFYSLHATKNICSVLIRTWMTVFGCANIIIPFVSSDCLTVGYTGQTFFWKEQNTIWRSLDCNLVICIFIYKNRIHFYLLSENVSDEQVQFLLSIHYVLALFIIN